MDASASTSTSLSDSGLQTPVKRQKVEKLIAKTAIVNTMLHAIGKFGGVASCILVQPKLDDEDYRRLYRLYKAAVKALILLEMECGDIEFEIKPLEPCYENILRSNNDNVKSWSEYFYANPSPTEVKRSKTVPSEATKGIGGLCHSVGAFVGLTMEAVCSNKRNPENVDNLKNLLSTSVYAAKQLIIIRDDITKELEPYLESKRRSKQ